MNPLVTVVIPSYNHEKYVGLAVDSCLSQTYTNLEVVVVDDGSQDNSVDCLRERYAKDERVRIFTQEHKGAHAALNEGIRQASGEYIAILNSDDLFDHRRIEVLLREAQQVDGTGALVFSDLEFIDGEGHPASEHQRAHGYRALQQRCQKQAIESVFLVGNVAMTSSNLFFSKALFSAVGEFAALRYTHDWEWALRATVQRRPIWVRENLLSYRVHGSNTISEGDIWCHIRENAFVHAKAIWALKERLASQDNLCRAGRDAYSALLHNQSFLPLPTLYFLVQRLAGLTEARLLELVTANDERQNLQGLASELGLSADPFLSVQHILEREYTIAAQAILIEERWAAMQRMEAMIRERDETIAAQAQMLEERWAAMQQMEQEIASRDRWSWGFSKEAQRQSVRSLTFRSRLGNRYWWHRMDNASYEPPIYSFLSDDEWRLMEEWFLDTDQRYGPGTGECGVPAISLLHGLIMGSGLSRIVQCGHYIGYSTLLIGYMLNKMGVSKGLFSIDINADVTEYTRNWVARAGLTDQVFLHVSDSTATDLPNLAKQFFGGAGIQLVFIDSSHQYEHTLAELDLWFPALDPGGLLVLHDVSRFASTFDTTGQGGPFRAITEWCTTHGLSFLTLNSFVRGGVPGQFGYADGCGLALIQKAPS